MLLTYNENFILEYTIVASEVGEMFSSSLTKTFYVTKSTWYYIIVDVMLTDLESSDEYLDIINNEYLDIISNDNLLGKKTDEVGIIKLHF